MTFEVRITPDANMDLDEYAEFIARDSKFHAQRWLSQVWEIIFSLAEMPERFPVYPESAASTSLVRVVSLPTHRILYRVLPDEKVVTILRVWHTARRPLGSTDFPN